VENVNKFMTKIGGKRGLAIILSTIATLCGTLGLIPNATAVELSGLVTALLGGAGIIHANMKK